MLSLHQTQCRINVHWNGVDELVGHHDDDDHQRQERDYHVDHFAGLLFCVGESRDLWSVSKICESVKELRSEQLCKMVPSFEVLPQTLSIKTDGSQESLFKIRT